jgi:hypothetical protein
MDRIALEIRADFNRMIDGLTEHFGYNRSWLYSVPGSRNPLVSGMFYYCTCLALIQNMVRSGEKVDEIVTDSSPLAGIIEVWSRKNHSPLAIRLEKEKKGTASRIREGFRHLLGVLAASLWSRLVVKLNKPRRAIPNEALTLVDTFAMADFVAKDRYYPGLLEALSPTERDRVFFVPTFYGARLAGLRPLINATRQAPRNFVLKEDFLRVTDYLGAWIKALPGLRRSVPKTTFENFDVTSLIQEERRRLANIGQVMRGLLAERFPKRLREAGIQVRLLIDWFENQPIDKGLIAGFKRYYPETPTVGYQGFITHASYVSLFPTRAELEAGSLPDEIAVLGPLHAQEAIRFCPEMPVAMAPAFRFAHLFKSTEKSSNTETFTVLVVLPQDRETAEAVMAFVIEVYRKYSVEIPTLVKSHPASDFAFDGLTPENMKQVQGDMAELLGRAGLVVSTASGVCLEAVARGVPVVVLGIQGRLTLNPIPTSVPPSAWRMCYSHEELISGIEYFQDRGKTDSSRFRVDSENTKSDFFTPVTHESVRDFLKLD